MKEQAHIEASDVSGELVSQAQKLAAHFRRHILAGNLKVGDKLPTTRQLAAEYSMSIANVQRALQALVHEKLITRVPHHGTVVSSSYLELRNVAIVHHVDYEYGIPRYAQALTMHLIKKLDAIGCSGVILYRNMVQLTGHDLRNIIDDFKVQGMIFHSTLGGIFDKIKHFNLPVVTTNQKFRDNCVSLDLAQLAEEAPKKLAEMGCRRPGILWNTPALPIEKLDAYGLYCEQQYNKMLESCAEAGMAVSPERVVRLGKFKPVSEYEFTRAAYNAVRNMLALPSPPDGWLVFDDNFTDGAIQALLEAGHKPGPMLFHVSKGIKHIFPYPHMEAVADMEYMAEIMVDMLCAQIRGEKSQYKCLPYEFRYNDSVH